MQLISKSNKEICFLLCVIDIFSKYGWVNKGNEFYNGSMKSWLKKWYKNVFNTK